MSLRIVVCVSRPDLRDSITSYLTSVERPFFLVGSGGLARSLDERPSPDVVLCEPSNDNFAEFVAFSRRNSEVAWVVFGGHLDESKEERASTHPSWTYLRGETLEAIQNAVRRTLLHASTKRTLRRLAKDSPSKNSEEDRTPPSVATSRARLIPQSEARLIDLLVIGVSTGGPEALAVVVPGLARDVRCPVLIVQHMPGVFTKKLALQLDELSALEVREAVAGEPLKNGTVYLAPGGFHMSVQFVDGERRVALDQGPLVHSCRPAVDVLLASIAAAGRGRTTAVCIMTGMGYDGLNGTRAVREQGACVLAQDRDSCTVWGMPRGIQEAGLADQVLPLAQLAPAINRLLGTGRSA